MMSLNGDVMSCQAIIGSIEKRWNNSDQPPFIAAIILNPLLKIAPFSSHSFLTLASIHQLLRSLFVRFFPGEEPPWLFTDVSEYLEGKGNFSPMEDIISEVRKGRAPDVGIYHGYIPHCTHVGQAHGVDPLEIWKAMTLPNVTPPPLYVSQSTYFQSMPTPHHANDSSACSETSKQSNEIV
jgi:hypothetical protein